jgi:hypothetical protein
VDTVTHSATPNPERYEPNQADRARAERIAALVVDALGKPHYLRQMTGPTRAVQFWLVLESSERFRHAQGIVQDAISDAMARLIADERTPVAPLADAGDTLRAWVESLQPDLYGEQGIFVGLVGYALDQVNWPDIAATFANQPHEVRRKVADDVLAIFAEMDAISQQSDDADL